jgi:DNA-binding HxlR family transcriptional regulator
VSTWKSLCTLVAGWYGVAVAKRSYQQSCGLAAALDVVGERWALLVVRDLAPGPRRFTDLHAELPGLATDVLTDRLRSLEAAGAVETVEVRDPVPGRLYRLTPRGEQLAAIAGDLARWGMPLLGAPGRSGARRNVRWALQAMATNYRGGLPDGEYRWSVGDQALHTRVDQDRARLHYGHGADTPRIHVRGTADAFGATLRRTRPGVDRPTFDGLEIDGDPSLFARVLSSMPLRRSESVDAG